MKHFVIPEFVKPKEKEEEPIHIKQFGKKVNVRKKDITLIELQGYNRHARRRLAKFNSTKIPGRQDFTKSV